MSDPNNDYPPMSKHPGVNYPCDSHVVVVNVKIRRAVYNWMIFLIERDKNKSTHEVGEEVPEHNHHKRITRKNDITGEQVVGVEQSAVFLHV